MDNKIVKFTDEQLQTIKISAILNVVKEKISDPELEEFKKCSNEERRNKVIELYKKYIDAVIAEQDSKVAEQAAANAKAEKDAEEKAASEKEAAQNSASDSTEASEDVNISMAFSTDIRGISGFNGTRTMSCEKLLLLAFRNPKARITFFTQERAKQFINIVKNIKSVKGIAALSEDAKTNLIENLKIVNNLK